jgi:NitT/TauT family transport system substrate-binding protein
VAISQNTIIEYITDRLLQAEGLSSDQIKVTEISAIPVRFEQLMAGQVQAATLPDPLAQGALAAGALLVVDDSQHAQYSQSVLCFAQSAVEAKPDTIEKFLKAWNRAVGDMNGNPEEFTDLLIEKGRVPESIRDAYQMPRFPVGEVPTEAEWQDVVDWMLDKGLIEHPLPYDGSVLSVFVEG